MSDSNVPTRVDIHHRLSLLESGIWAFTDAIGLEASYEVASIDCTLKLADVYERVSFPSNSDSEE